MHLEPPTAIFFYETIPAPAPALIFNAYHHAPTPVENFFESGLYAYHFRYTLTMPNYTTHPLRQIRRLHGMEMVELARLAGVSRATISQIEEGRTKKPNKKVVHVLSRMSGATPEELYQRVDEWRDTKTEEVLPQRWKALLNLPAEDLATFYPSFQHWRMELSENPTHFASVLRINRLTVSKYERDQFVGGMPDTLVHALAARLGITEDYLNALEGLPPCLKTTS